MYKRDCHFPADLAESYTGTKRLSKHKLLKIKELILNTIFDNCFTAA